MRTLALDRDQRLCEVLEAHVAVCSLEKPEEAASLSDRERVPLRYVDLIATNRYLEQNDDIFAQLRLRFSDREIVDLGFLLVGVYATQWMRSILREDLDELPPDFQGRPGEAHFARVGEFVNTPDKRGMPFEPTYRQDAEPAVQAVASSLSSRRTDARLVPLRREEFEPHYRAYTAHLDDHELGVRRIFAHSPVIAQAWEEYVETLTTKGNVPRRLLELARLRVAFTNQSPNDMALRDTDAHLDESTIRSLERSSTASGLSEAERLMVHYADLITGHHFAISDEAFDQLRRHFTEGQILEFGPYVTGQMVMGRVIAGWHFTDELPQPYREAVPGQLRFRADVAIPVRWRNRQDVATSR